LATAAAPHAPAERHPLLAFVAVAWSWLFLLLLVLFFEVWARVQYGSTFVLNPYNLQSIALAASMPLLLGLGQTLVIIAGGIDLSVGFVMGLAAVIMATVMQATAGLHPGLSLLLGIVAALAVSVIPGLISGTLIARLAIPAFIGTLGMYGVCRGVGFLTLVVLVMHWLLRESRFGRYTYAIGGSKPAAIRAGIDVPRHTVLLYMLASFCAGIAGVVYTARFSAGAAQGGEPLLLDSIAAVVIGGASLFGGSGTIIGTVIGALIIAVIQYGLVFINVAPFWQFVAVGVVIIVSVLIDQSRERLTGGGRRDE
jgi:predicted ABC-type sugar transport system permease subunit